MTPLFKRLGFLLVLGLVWLAPAKANAPYVVQACTSTSNLSGGAYNGTWYCHLNSTTSGNTTRFYDNHGAYSGKTETSGGTNRYYDASGRYVGRGT